MKEVKNNGEIEAGAGAVHYRGKTSQQVGVRTERLFPYRGSEVQFPYCPCYWAPTDIGFFDMSKILYL